MGDDFTAEGAEYAGKEGEKGEVVLYPLALHPSLFYCPLRPLPLIVLL